MMNFQDFKTFNEPCLIEMRNQGKKFGGKACRKGEPPYWLSFCGTSGAGKTFLSRIIYEEAKLSRVIREHPVLVHGAMRVMWPELVMDLYPPKSAHYRIDDLKIANLLFLDDISTGSDRTGFERECLWRLLSARVGKWTIITSNLTLKEIADSIDARIASRMTRDGNIAIEINTTDYGLR